MIPAEIQLPGDVVHVERIIEDTGIHVWKVRLNTGHPVLAVKYATDDADPAGIHRRYVAREASVLTHLDHGYMIAAGDTPHGSWLATAWRDGPTLAEQWRYALDGGPDARITAADSARRSAALIASLHEREWRHGDLQGGHLFLPDCGPAQLIDYALAQGPAATSPDVPFRGGFAHLNAPEIAAELLATPNTHHVELTREAEVYTFGAVLYTSWARRWPRNYRGVAAASLRAPDIYQAIADPTTLQPAPKGWPTMATLIGSMLDQHPENRPTMPDVLRTITENVSPR
ncbi:hypothetical protein F4553_000074 [Allocatelliglobosispora scoriae]|uniref:Protein kinase domain-containing protein n=1 Tax=Allocatelliglobosispora scoriae TaxID=643052 RepID=A0A841BGD5_9ACTN|nr:hypothetical protein [Allocatelliglobosispora scoriae]MBB5866695.1 hypothetical protein [Allocatelliglobosispora scoriae]